MSSKMAQNTESEISGFEVSIASPESIKSSCVLEIKTVDDLQSPVSWIEQLMRETTNCF
jgi:hypothetical protein